MEAADVHNSPAQIVFETAQEIGVIHSETFVGLAHLPTQYDPDDSKVEYVPTGARLSHDMFCTSYEDHVMPGDPCGVCSEDFLEDDVLVRAKCQARHVFRKYCLGIWVNESAMDNANRCPLDLDIMCEARGRTHLGEQVGITSMDTRSLHHVGNWCE